jgi:hypothetical protein
MPTSDKVSPARKAIDYAESQLEVNSTWQRAKQVQLEASEAIFKLAELRNEKRAIENSMSNVEMTLAIYERGKHSDMSAAAMDKHLKAEIHSNKEHASLRSKLSTLHNAIDATEAKRSSYESELRILVARMTELGGYLTYLAAVKTFNEKGEQNALAVKRSQIWD